MFKVLQDNSRSVATAIESLVSAGVGAQLMHASLSKLVAVPRTRICQSNTLVALDSALGKKGYISLLPPAADLNSQNIVTAEEFNVPNAPGAQLKP